MIMKKKTYSQTKMNQLIEEVKLGKSVYQVAKAHHLPASTLYGWIKNSEKNPKNLIRVQKNLSERLVQQKTSPSLEVEVLQKEIQKLKNIIADLYIAQKPS